MFVAAVLSVKTVVGSRTVAEIAIASKHIPSVMHFIADVIIIIIPSAVAGSRLIALRDHAE